MFYLDLYHLVFHKVIKMVYCMWEWIVQSIDLIG